MRQAEFNLTVMGWVRQMDYPKLFKESEIIKVRSIGGGGCWVETPKGNYRVKESLATINRKIEGVDC